MKLNSSRSAAPRSSSGLALVILSSGLALCLTSTPLWAQGQPDPKDWDYDIRTDKSSYAAGDTVKATAGVVARKAGVQGWSYGVKHDTAILTIESATTDGTDVPGVFNAGFNQTTLIDQGGVKTGFIQAVVLSLVSSAEIPVSDYFSMAAISYTVSKDACQGKSGDLKTKIEFTEELAVKGGPPVELNLTILGVGIVPEKVLGEEVTVECAQTPAEDGLVLEFDDSDTDLVADQKSVYDLKVLLQSNEKQGNTEVQGWSYGVRMDLTQLEAISGEPGADSQALHGGAGPDFKSYNLDEKSADGKERGVTVGVVIDLDAPGTEVLDVEAGQSKHLDTIKLRSRTTIPEGGASKEVTLGFTDKLGGDRPLEVLIVIEGEGIVPDFAGPDSTLDLTLTPSGAPGGQQFIRGDSNDDTVVDIADGLWILNELFYDGPDTKCVAAADANDDDRVDVADCMYIFNHQLQPGRQSSNLFPAPPAPYPNCGTATSALACPAGSTSCQP